jgi:hypothetical protein
MTRMAGHYAKALSAQRKPFVPFVDGDTRRQAAGPTPGSVTDA